MASFLCSSGSSRPRLLPNVCNLGPTVATTNEIDTLRDLACICGSMRCCTASPAKSIPEVERHICERWQTTVAVHSSYADAGHKKLQKQKALRQNLLSHRQSIEAGQPWWDSPKKTRSVRFGTCVSIMFAQAYVMLVWNFFLIHVMKHVCHLVSHSTEIIETKKH